MKLMQTPYKNDFLVLSSNVSLKRFKHSVNMYEEDKICIVYYKKLYFIHDWLHIAVNARYHP